MWLIFNFTNFKAIEETAEAASISATEEAVTATTEAAAPTVEASSEGALAEAAPVAASNSGKTFLLYSCK